MARYRQHNDSSRRLRGKVHRAMGLDQIFGPNIPLPARFIVVFVIVLALMAVFFWGMRRLFGTGLVGGAGRKGEPRIAVVEAANLDGRRKLLIIRRDQVEHLVMIGGPNDVVIESQFTKTQPVFVPREDRNGLPDPSLTRAAPTAPVAPQSPSLRPEPAPAPIAARQTIPQTIPVAQPSPASAPIASAPAAPAPPAPRQPPVLPQTLAPRPISAPQTLGSSAAQSTPLASPQSAMAPGFGAQARVQPTLSPVAPPQAAPGPAPVAQTSGTTPPAAPPLAAPQPTATPPAGTSPTLSLENEMASLLGNLRTPPKTPPKS